MSDYKRIIILKDKECGEDVEQAVKDLVEAIEATNGAVVYEIGDDPKPNRH